MVTLFKKSEKTALPNDEIVTDYPLPPVNDLTLGGRDVNLILMVKEHAPIRVEQIIKEVDGMLKRITALEEEKDTLLRLISALTQNKG